MQWIASQRLCKHGNSVSVTIPKEFLRQLGWLCGRGVVLELTENKEQLILRLPVPSDFGPVGRPFIQRREEPVQP
jgi:hypothetical protein